MRPRTKDPVRLDTKVRLARRHVEALDAYEHEHGPGQRNAVIEKGLDLFFGLGQEHRPRLMTGGPDSIEPPAPENHRASPTLVSATTSAVEAARNPRPDAPTTKGRAAPRGRP